MVIDVNCEQLSELNEEMDQPLGIDISTEESPMLTAFTEGALSDCL